jgi:hypothetical protein
LTDQTLSLGWEMNYVMQKDAQAENWTWTPAAKVGTVHRLVLGGFILGIACLLLGMLIGRLSVLSPNVQVTEHRREPTQVPAPKTAERPLPKAAPQLDRASVELPSVGKDEAPSSAVGGHEMQDNSASFHPPVPPILLNPGTAEPSRTVEKREPPARWSRALAKTASTRRYSDWARGQSVTISRDYLALRNYVLSK